MKAVFKSLLVLLLILFIVPLIAQNTVSGQGQNRPAWIGGLIATPEIEAELTAIPFLELSTASTKLVLPTGVDNSQKPWDLYLRMEENGTKGVTGKLKQYIPESKKKHQQQTEQALSLLPKKETTNTIERKHRDLPEQLWTDIVTEQPEGYVVDENGDVHIYTAEGLAWVSVVSNGLHGQEVDDFNGKAIYLEEDVDLSRYAWNPIGASFWNSVLGEIHYYFKGVFEGNGHQIDNLILSEGFLIQPEDFQITHSGLFGNVNNGEIRNVRIENCIVNYLPGLLAYELRENSLVNNVVAHCLSFKAEQGAMFMEIREGSTVENCLVHYDYKEEEDYGSGLSTYNQGHILNCASIIDTLYWSWGGCSGLVYDNWGQIKNCYSYWGELKDFPYYGGGPAPRNGVCEGNGGVVENCYYNRMPQELGFDDGPGEGEFQDVSSFFRYDLYYNWMLTDPIHVCDPNLAWQYDLVDALNYWIDCQANGGDYRRWYVDPSGSNDKLPVFIRELPEQYWTDIVTEQPEGYIVDSNGDVHIQSAEGLAWLCSVTNGLNGQEATDFEGKEIILEADVDMSKAVWTSICCGASSFKGTFNGMEHIIDGLRITKADGSPTGFFGSLLEARVFDFVIRDGFFKGSGSNIGFLASQATKSSIDHCFVECVMHGGECAPFVYSNYGSTITNSMVYCPFLRNYEDYDLWGGTFVAENRRCEDLTLPQIVNCAAIIKYMDCGLDIGFSGQNNQGLIENCYVQINEIMHCAGSAPGAPPRNGITKNNQGEVVNSYYNSPLRVMSLDGLMAIPLEDVPCQYNTGLVRDVVSFDRGNNGGWKLSEALSFELENGTVTTDDLLEALNFKVELLNNPELLDWCDVAVGFDNQQLPVFCGVNIVETDEHLSITDSFMLYPNPTNGNVWVDGVEVSEIQIYNVMGQLLKSYRGIHEISVSDLPRGIYLLHITDCHGVISKKKMVVE